MKIPHIHENEIKLLDNKNVDRDDIQCYMIQGEKSVMYINECNLDKGNLFIGFIEGDKKIVMARHSNRYLSQGIDEDNSFLRVTFDCRKTDIKFHVVQNDRYLKLKNSDDSNNVFMIVMVECAEFLQLSLYDGSLEQKVSHIFVTAANIKDKLRVLTFSMLNNRFPSFYDNLKFQMEAE
ncbi:hypothetical protein [Paenibacillus sp. 2003]|uniref:hypothetical protein n=1 Tax=Paenibacillus sp. 2003 TaxID=2817761 RepID=UPI00285C0F65|nr:hypothetical protein [Paenibacillus sp. 2003]MDR6720885.1 hypothetical protein [Paenibacillus sp. 2003]